MMRIRGGGEEEEHGVPDFVFNGSRASNRAQAPRSQGPPGPASDGDVAYPPRLKRTWGIMAAEYDSKKVHGEDAQNGRQVVERLSLAARWNLPPKSSGVGARRGGY